MSWSSPRLSRTWCLSTLSFVFISLMLLALPRPGAGDKTKTLNQDQYTVHSIRSLSGRLVSNMTLWLDIDTNRAAMAPRYILSPHLADDIKAIELINN